MRLTYPLVRTTARTVLRKYGTEYNYKALRVESGECCYQPTAPDNRRCFIGEILAELGLLNPYEGRIEMCNLPDHYQPTAKALAFMEAAQKWQDNRASVRHDPEDSTWGNAFVAGVAAAERV